MMGFLSSIFSSFFTPNHTIVIGMGSNLGDREKIMNEALKELKKLGTEFQVSSLWETEPWDNESTELFLNAVVICKTKLLAHHFLEKLHEIEDQFGRKRQKGTRWANRTIDLDILFYDEKIIETVDFHVPHEYLHRRAFVLIPLAEINPEYFVFHLQKTAQQMVNAIPEHEHKTVRKFSSFSQ